MPETKSERLTVLEEFYKEFPEVWKNMPGKGLFTALLVAWVLLFEFLGNSTFGYINTYSLFAWSSYAYYSSPDDEHGLLIPFLVLLLFWWKRNDFKGMRAEPWMPGIVLVAMALAIHLVGYVSQQTRISLAAFFLGLYGLIGVTWGPRVLRASFFPMCLFAFALPLGTLAETITFPLRLMATTVTGTFAGDLLGINVVVRGTQILDPTGKFHYEVAAACGGLRSLTAVLALCTIYAFINLQSFARRAILIAAGFPLAVIGNITRLMAIIILSDAFGQKYGEMAHDSTWFSLLPYIPPIIGIMVLGHILREEKDSNERNGPDKVEFSAPAPGQGIAVTT